MADGIDRLHGLRDFARAVSSSGSVTDLVDRGAAVALALLGADSVSVSRLEPRARAAPRACATSAALADWEQERPTDVTYSLADYPHAQAACAPGAGTWTGSLDDPDIDPADADLLRRLGMRHAASFGVLVADQVWGEVYVTRAGDGAVRPRRR